MRRLPGETAFFGHGFREAKLSKREATQPASRAAEGSGFAQSAGCLGASRYSLVELGPGKSAAGP